MSLPFNRLQPRYAHLTTAQKQSLLTETRRQIDEIEAEPSFGWDGPVPAALQPRPTVTTSTQLYPGITLTQTRFALTF